MKQKVFRGAIFFALVIAGAITASVVAGSGPSRILQTVSSSVSTTTTSTTTTTTPKKITICHHAATKAGKIKHVTIRISRSAWKAHQKHGDSLGACNTAFAKKFHSRPAHIKKFHKRRHPR
jgi:ABC-type uncharacterized transport system auxiliary subunit